MDWRKFRRKVEKFAKVVRRNARYLVYLAIIAAYVLIWMYVVHEAGRQPQWRELLSPITAVIGGCMLVVEVFVRWDWKKIRWTLQNVAKEHVRYIVYAVLLTLYIIFAKSNSDTNANSPLDLPDLLSVKNAVFTLALLMAELLVRFLSRAAQKHLEDSTKLTEDYEALIERYNRVNPLEYARTKFPAEVIAFRQNKSTPFEFDFDPSGKSNNYEVPEQIKRRSDELMKAHDCSQIYNNTNVRIDKCHQVGNKVEIGYSRTKYYDLLITNRVMDYPLQSEQGHTVKSVREIYEPGPFLSPLSESKLSNHLGFNGFVQLADGYVVFVQRNENVSVGKRHWSASVNASYKSKYGLNDRREMTAKHIGDAIRQEIKDELKISVKKDVPLEQCIFAFYRDLVEGGKPHFVFFYRETDPIWTRDYFTDNFKREYKKRKAEQAKKRMKKEEKIKDNMIEDGEYFEFFTVDELTKSKIDTNHQLIMEDNKTKYRLDADGSTALALLLKYLTEEENPVQIMVYQWIKQNIALEVAQMPAKKRLTNENIDKLSQVLVQVLWGETTFEKAAYDVDEFLSETELQKWIDRAKEQFKDALEKAVWTEATPKTVKIKK